MANQDVTDLQRHGLRTNLSGLDRPQWSRMRLRATPRLARPRPSPRRALPPANAVRQTAAALP
jgi:hypothetical protein